MTGRSILVIENDERLRCAIQAQLAQAGFEVFLAATAEAALDVLEASRPALVLSGLEMPGVSSAELLRELRPRLPDTPLILISATASGPAVPEPGDGAYDVISRPVDFERLLVVLERALERHDLLDPVLNPRAALDLNPGFDSITGRSPALLRVLHMAVRAARTDSVVLLTGETGTGKELLARAIHRTSRRKDRPFAVINCGAIPRGLLESELFGHTRGSFTGAVADRRGRVEAADGGTLFLDEIGELPLELQVKLLRLIQQGDIEKVGAAGSIRVDVRIVAATHRNLRSMVDAGTFREDLYYRLAVIPLELPPLRARREDIPELALTLFERLKRRHGRQELRMPAGVLHLLAGHDWPGNVRELENVVERMVVLTAGNEISRDDLPEFVGRKAAVSPAQRLELPAGHLSLEGVEKEIIVGALRKFGWNQTHAAQYLNISRRTLIYRMEKYGLKGERERSPRQDV